MRPPLEAALAISMALLALAGCKSADDEPLTDGCKAGIRSQCVMQIALGDRFACARMHDRSVWCWGKNDQSQLGYSTEDLCPEDAGNGNTQSIACHTFPFQIDGLDSVQDVAAGAEFACARKTDGTVWCWGAGGVGQLGHGDTRSSQSPTLVLGLPPAQAIAVGARHACALVDGAVYCWGAGDSGQLGESAPGQLCDMFACETSPKQVAGVSGAIAIVGGDAHTCALFGDGSAMCWGANDYGQLGTGDATPRTSGTPLAVKAAHLKVLAAGASHTCGLRDDGAVFCWGRDDNGQLGAPPDPSATACRGPCSATPVLVAALPGAPLDPSQPDAGPSGSGSEDGGVAPPDLAAVPVGGNDPPPRSLAAGGAHSCAVLADETMRCWGEDGQGELGDGPHDGDSHPPVIVIAHPGAAPENPLQSVSLAAAGTAGGCARLDDGSLRCWGSNGMGALGTGDLAPQAGPVAVAW